MRLKNSTDLPDALVRKIVRFVKPHQVAGFDLRVGVTDDWGFKGRAYAGGSHYHAQSMRAQGKRNQWAPHVSAYLGARQRYPVKPCAPWRPGYLPHPYFADETEVLVFLIAHELRHLWQKKVPRGWRVWGARGQYSERDADAYAIRMLRAWRKAH